MQRITQKRLYKEEDIIVKRNDCGYFRSLPLINDRFNEINKNIITLRRIEDIKKDRKIYWKILGVRRYINDDVRNGYSKDDLENVYQNIILKEQREEKLKRINKKCTD